jgi:hypothetical protein
LCRERRRKTSTPILRIALGLMLDLFREDVMAPWFAKIVQLRESGRLLWLGAA